MFRLRVLIPDLLPRRPCPVAYIGRSGVIRIGSKKNGPYCQVLGDEIRTVGEYLDLFSSLLKEDGVFWFRGHANYKWPLAPSALRFAAYAKRKLALGLLSNFKRYGESKLDTPPASGEYLKWVQIAQHYGLPTRLLDWTENAQVALYFACSEPDVDGMVFLMNPVDLNKQSTGNIPRILDPHQDVSLIRKYLRLGPKKTRSGLKTVAVNPIWNCKRIEHQQGVFTLHGSPDYSLDRSQAPSLVGLPILSAHKQTLLEGLEMAGKTEMTIFPELEHLCNYLKRPLYT